MSSAAKGVAGGIGAAIIAAVAACFLVRRRKNKTAPPNESQVKRHDGTLLKVACPSSFFFASLHRSCLQRPAMAKLVPTMFNCLGVPSQRKPLTEDALAAQALLSAFEHPVPSV